MLWKFLPFSAVKPVVGFCSRIHNFPKQHNQQGISVSCQNGSYLSCINMWSKCNMCFGDILWPQYCCTCILQVENWNACLRLMADTLSISFETMYTTFRPFLRWYWPIRRLEETKLYKFSVFHFINRCFDADYIMLSMFIAAKGKCWICRGNATEATWVSRDCLAADTSQDIEHYQIFWSSAKMLHMERQGGFGCQWNTYIVA